MVTEALKRVVDQVAHLPPEEQDAIAELIERALADRKWEELFASPESDRFLARLEVEIRREKTSR